MDRLERLTALMRRYLFEILNVGGVVMGIGMFMIKVTFPTIPTSLNG